MRRYIFLLLWLCGSTMALASSVGVDTSPDTIVSGQPFHLTFTITGHGSTAVPDFAVLEKQFEILSTGRSSEISIINGRTQSTTSWELVLQPKHSGIITVPAIDFGHSQRSAPVKLQVKPATTAKTDLTADDSDLFMVATVDETQVHVQQQLTYRVRLYYRRQPVSGSFVPPRISQGLIETLGDSRNYQTTYHGQPYRVAEQDYAVFPERSGELTIDSPIFKGVLALPASQLAADPFLFGNQRNVRILAKPIHLSVNPIPSGFPKDTPFLPASLVTIGEQWQGLSPNLTVGQPITRTITLHATGLTASQLPDINSATITGLHHYPQPTVQDDRLSGHRVLGSKRFKIVYLPSQAGDFTLPSVRIPWWNVDKQRVETAELPAKTITIAAAVPSVNTANNTSTQARAATTTQPQATVPPITRPTAPPSPTITPCTPPSSHITAWLPWVLLLVVSIGWWWERRRRHPLAPITQGQQPRQKQTQRNDPIPQQRQWSKALKQACMGNDAAQSKAALLSWAKQRFPQAGLREVNDLGKVIDDAAFMNEVARLEAALYCPGRPSWSGKSLWAAFVIVDKIQQKKRLQSGRKGKQLPPFNPE